LNNAHGMSITLRQVNVNPPGAQINWVGGAGLVDRCQSCHVATDPLIVPIVMTLTKADLGMANSKNAPFATHPNPALLKAHPLEKFGCSPCHGGNGRALDSVEKAHGRYEHWLWPLNYPENFEAGCQQCHAADMVTEEARNLNRGKDLYRSRGCIGCHRFQGFDNQDEQLVSARQNILQLTSAKAANLLEIPRLNKLGDQASDNVAANRLYTQATNLNVTTANIDAQLEQLEQRSHNLIQEIKKIGPDLKEVRMKLRKEWIPYWLGNTHTFRPTTKMPQFRLQQDEIQALSAFVWQSGLTGPALAKQAPGNSAHGKTLLESRGCLACHSVGEGTAQMGGTFAANLSRVGEKDNYDYLVRWVHNPRERTRPYCSFEKKDLGPEDYAKHNLPYVFDNDHSRCPNDGHELTVQQPTPMPNLRLSPEDARDVASYLITLKHADATYAAAPFMDDPALKDKGKTLAQFYGCAGCHEISGLEEEGRIGTELTTEGSKPVERLDFALLTEDAKLGRLPDGKPSPRGPWHDLKGFVENKLANPAIFDTGKYKPNSTDRLRMPKPNVTPADITALTTMLLGSSDASLPPEYMYKPSDDRAAIQKGWWIVSKYNCMGCHQVGIGQDSVLMGLPMYQGENKVNLPPVLTSEGARVNPEWLRRFLADPSLSGETANRNGVRPYLQVRMPTFSFSDDEVRSLIAFFEAISHQPQQFIPQKLQTLTPAEVTMGRQLFTSTAAPCLKCHATGDPGHDASATAPNFLLAKERLRAPWMARWLTNPQQLAPGTAMPSGLFRRDTDRWLFAGPLPGAFQGYTGDHADLLVRYMLQLTPEEQRSLIGRTPTGAN
jgi:cytochrome c2